MMDTPPMSLLDDELSVLVNHFGIDRVRSALNKLGGQTPPTRTEAQSRSSRERKPIRTSVIKRIEDLRETDKERHELLGRFADQLAHRTVLPDADDIRRFSHLVGMKSIDGRSRRDLVNELLEFLLVSPIDQIKEALPEAGRISEKQRQQGFGILTDKLLDTPSQRNRT